VKTTNKKGNGGKNNNRRNNSFFFFFGCIEQESGTEHHCSADGDTACAISGDQEQSGMFYIVIGSVIGLFFCCAPNKNAEIRQTRENMFSFFFVSLIASPAFFPFRTRVIGEPPNSDDVAELGRQRRLVFEKQEALKR